MIVRKFILFILATLLCFILLYKLYPSNIEISTNYINHHESKLNNNTTLKSNMFLHKNAFATVLCDSTLIEPTLVSLYTLNSAFSKKPSSKVDIIVLISDNLVLEPSQLKEFQQLHAIILQTSSAQNKKNQSCQSIINLWTLTDYEKVAYFTPDILFENDVDQLFKFPIGSAIPSKKDTPSPLFILEPNLNRFELISSNIKEVSNQVNILQLIEKEYLEHHLRIPKHLTAKNFIYFGERIKPWNFHYYKKENWSKLIDRVTFYKWRKAYNDARHFFDPNRDWSNEFRQRSVCDKYLRLVSKKKPTRPLIDNKFSVLIGTYNPERIEHLSFIIRHLLKSKMVHTVYITWHNPKLQVPPSLYSDISKKDHRRVKVLTQAYDSLNNRFNPIEDLMTDAVYMLDDDIFVDIQDIEFTFEIWRNRKNSVVGHFPRVHTYDSETKSTTYKVPWRLPYSIILTKSMFVKSDYLFTYTCLLEPKLHEYVDDRLNCEDIGFMMMASGVSGTGSTFVHTEKPLEDFGLQKGISVNDAHMPARSQCISDFITDFWLEKDPLILSYDTVTRFERPLVTAGNWDEIDGVLH